MLYYIQLLNADGSLNGAPVSTQSLGIEDIEFDLNNLAADTWTFTVGGLAIDAAQLWPYGQLMAIQDASGKRLAFGRIEPWTRRGTPDAQDHLGRLVNPWWYLTKKIYQQRYSIATGNYPNVGGSSANVDYEVFTTPRVVLNILYNGTAGGFYSATTGQQIADAVNWAIAQGAPIALGVTDPSTQPFSDFHKGIFCSDVVMLQFRKEPDFVMDWDYTTLPFPTVHFRKSKSQTALVIDLTDTTRREQVMVRERPDWQRSYVNICYDQTNTQNGQAFLTIDNDLYPSPMPAGTEAAFNGVDLYCDLAGGSQTTSAQTASLASMALDPTNLATWQRWCPELAAANIASVVILTAGSTPPADDVRVAPAIVPRDEYDAAGNPVALNPACLYELVDGEWADWTGIAGQRVRITAWMQITTQNGEVKYEQHHAEPTLISINTGGIPTAYTQTTNTITGYAEPIPAGLAKAMWTSWHNLAIEGSFTNVESVLGTQAITRSNYLNFLTSNPGANGRPDWRAVNALVQRISGSCLKGTTKVDFGAPLHVTGNELIDAVRATRYRTTTIDLGYLFGGALGGGSGSVKFGRKTHARAAHHGATHTQMAAVSAAISPGPNDPIMTTDGTTGISSWTPPNGPAGPVSGGPAAPTVLINPASAKGSDGNWHTLQLAEMTTCESDGTQWTRIVLVSEKYKAAGQS